MRFSKIHNMDVVSYSSSIWSIVICPIHIDLTTAKNTRNESRDYVKFLCPPCIGEFSVNMGSCNIKISENTITKFLNYSPATSKELGKKGKGWCYIGTDRGYRSCIKVNRHDDCESKKVFPTMDVCINPELRQ